MAQQVCSFVSFGKTRLWPAGMWASRVSQWKVCVVFASQCSPLKSKSVLGLGIPPRKSLTVKHDVISCNKIPSPLLDKACHLVLLSHNFELNTHQARDWTNERTLSIELKVYYREMQIGNIMKIPELWRLEELYFCVWYNLESYTLQDTWVGPMPANSVCR